MNDFLYIKDGRELFQVFFSEILYLESANRYVKFIIAERSYLQECSLHKIETILPVDLFCRIHRNYIISFRYARHLNSKTVQVAGHEIPIGKSYRGILWSKIAMARSEGLVSKKVTGKVISLSA